MINYTDRESLILDLQHKAKLGEKIVVTGLNSCGKSYLVGRLTYLCDTYIKCNYDALRRYFEEPEAKAFINSFQVFDRHPIFDYPVYKELNAKHGIYEMSKDYVVDPEDYKLFDNVVFLSQPIVEIKDKETIKFFSSIRTNYLNFLSELSNTYPNLNVYNGV